MKPPKIALDLTTHEVVKDKPPWQRWLYARLHERSSDNTTRITYRDRDAAAKSPRRDQIQKWYEQIYSELAKAYGDLEKERSTLESNMEELHRSANRVDQQLHETRFDLEQVRAERDALIDILTRAHTAEKRIEDYTSTFMGSREFHVKSQDRTI